MSVRRLLKCFILVSVFVGLVGCKSLTALWHEFKPEEDDTPFKGQSAKQLYQDAKKAMKDHDYTGAIKRLEAMETMYPFHDDAEDAELALIYAYYEKEDYLSAGAASERFIHLYPRAKHVDYAYYIKAMSNFHQTRGPVATLLPLDQSWRDPGSQSQAYSDFATLVQRFPNSRYKADSEKHMIYLRNMFAQSELNVSKYYYERKRYVAAVERANYLIQTYPQAPSVQEALVMLYHGNKALGLTDAAKDAEKVYKDTYGNRVPDVQLM